MKRFPAIKLAVLFALGILLEKYFRIDYFVTASLIIPATVLRYIFRKRTTEYGLVLTRLLIAVSIIAMGNQTARLISTDYILIPENIYRANDVKLRGEVTKVNLIRKGEVDFEFTIERGMFNDTINAAGTKLICKVKDSQSKLKKIYDEIGDGNSIELSGNYIKGREQRNPGEFDYNKFLRGKGISGILYVYDVAELKFINKQNALFKNTIFHIRKSIDERIRNIYGPGTAGFLRGILLADRSEISYDEKTDFINSGVIHILAVSGLHVGYILLIFTFIFGRFNIYAKSILTAVGLTLFLLITGVPPSAFRATVMAVVLIAALLLNRSTNLLNSVAIAALIILAINPDELFNPGFQLSFSAVISIALIYPFFRDKITGASIRNKYLRDLLLFSGVSIAAQIGTLPFTIYYFGKISIIALATNLLVIPAAGIIVGIGILSLFLSVILPGIASYFTIVNELIVRTVYAVIHFTGGNSLSFLRIHNFSILDIVAFYSSLIILFFYYSKFQNRIAKLTLIILCTLCYLVTGTVDDIDLLPENKLSVLMVDVGQGDSFLVKFPNGKTALIDAGEANFSFDNGERVILPLLNYLGINKIDYGFVSHIDLDHYGGFISLIHNSKIGEIYKPELDSSLDKDLRFEKYLSEVNLKDSHYRREIIKIGNARIYVLNSNLNKDFSSNNNSGLLKIVYGTSEFLFTGDLEKPAERFYDEYYGNFLKADVLKVGHHGSKTSSSEEFLSLVSPGISLISAGIQNKFHHPSDITLEALKKYKSKIYRTDKSGAILLQSDGKSIKKIEWRVL